MNRNHAFRVGYFPLYSLSRTGEKNWPGYIVRTNQLLLMLALVICNLRIGLWFRSLLSNQSFLSCGYGALPKNEKFFIMCDEEHCFYYLALGG